MKFMIIRPKAVSTSGSLGTAEFADVAKLDNAISRAELSPGKLDHGTLARGVAIVVYEFGLFEPGFGYFSIGNRLFSGNAVIFNYSVDSGETESMSVDLYNSVLANIRFHSSAESVEKEIKSGKIARPEISIDREVVWRWPNPRPEHLLDKGES